MILPLIAIYIFVGFVFAILLDELQDSGFDFLARWIFWPIFFMIYIGKSFFELTEKAWKE